MQETSGFSQPILSYPAVNAELNTMIEKDEHKAGDWHHTDNIRLISKDQSNG